jgi:hypothetical protein
VIKEQGARTRQCVREARLCTETTVTNERMKTVTKEKSKTVFKDDSV